MNRLIQQVPGLVLALSILSTAFVTMPALATDGPEEVVAAFNRAISSENLEDALTHVAAGGVQFSLRAPHAGLPDPETVSSDLATHWKMIAPILFSVTEEYIRIPDVIETRKAPEVATVWTRMTTRTVDRNTTEAREQSFNEIYLLVYQQDRWQIAGIADSRETDSLDIGL